MSCVLHTGMAHQWNIQRYTRKLIATTLLHSGLHPTNSSAKAPCNSFPVLSWDPGHSVGYSDLFPCHLQDSAWNQFECRRYAGRQISCSRDNTEFSPSYETPSSPMLQRIFAYINNHRISWFPGKSIWFTFTWTTITRHVGKINWFLPIWRVIGYAKIMIYFAAFIIPFDIFCRLYNPFWYFLRQRYSTPYGRSTSFWAQREASKDVLLGPFFTTSQPRKLTLFSGRKGKYRAQQKALEKLAIYGQWNLSHTCTILIVNEFATVQ